MGVINLTPDSFSGAGAAEDPQAAAVLARRLADAGADWIDIGGESTRPGAAAVDEATESARVLPAIASIRAVCATPVSIDTRKPSLARAAIAAGAAMWNDVSALRAAGAAETAAELGCPVVLMHMRGEPATMQDDPRYADVVAEVGAFLAERAAAALSAGVQRDRIWLDPGLGFGKTVEHNLALIRGLPQLARLGFPLVVGASRKGMIGRLDPLGAEADDRLGGSLALALAAARGGAAMLRVHDVRETAQALSLQAALDA